MSRADPRLPAPGPHDPRLPAIDLSRCSVFIDFDGTISADDIGIVLLERFAAGRWEDVDGRYERGEIGSREYVAALWPLVDGVPYQDLLAEARTVPLDEGFGPLVDFLQNGGAEVAVVSDGIGFYVATRVARHGVRVMANAVHLEAGHARRARFPFAAPAGTCPSCGQCGTCKVAPVAEASRRGRTTIHVGDGTSDRFAAEAADLVFAKGRLVDWCRRSRIAYMPFSTLAEVHGALASLSADPSAPAP